MFLVIFVLKTLSLSFWDVCQNRYPLSYLVKIMSPPHKVKVALPVIHPFLCEEAHGHSVWEKNKKERIYTSQGKQSIECTNLLCQYCYQEGKCSKKI